MNIYINITKNGSKDGWGNEPPSAEELELFNALPSQDRECSIAAQRNADHSCSVAVKNVDNENTLLLLTQMTDVQARAFCAVYLTNKFEIVNKLSERVNADALTAYLDYLAVKYEVREDAPPRFSKVRADGTKAEDMLNKVAQILRSHRFTNTPGVCFVASDSIPLTSHQDAGIVLTSPHLKPAPFYKTPEGLIMLGIGGLAIGWFSTLSYKRWYQIACAGVILAGTCLGIEKLKR